MRHNITVYKGFSPEKSLEIWPYSLFDTTKPTEILLFRLRIPNANEVIELFKTGEEIYIQVPSENLLAKVIAIRKINDNVLVLWFSLKTTDAYAELAGQNSQAMV